MSFSRENLLERKKLLEVSLTETQALYESLKGTNSIAETVVGNDLLTLTAQLVEVSNYLNTLPPEPSLPIGVLRREVFPSTPTLLIDGIPPDNGIPASALTIKKADGTTYNVDSNGKVFPRINP